jgi:hypothetical protein
MFNEGRTNVHDEDRSGRPSLITEDLKNRIDQHIRTNRLYLFTHLKQFLGSTHMDSDEDWFNGIAADLYDAGIQKLITR